MDGYTVYLGGGLGIAEVDIDFSPSGVVVVDDTESAVLYQFMAGASVPYTDTTEIFGGYRYRATEDLSVDGALFPVALDIENSAHIFEVGVRFHF